MATVAEWRNPDSAKLPNLIQCAAIDSVCVSRGAARAPFFEAYAAFLDENHAEQPIKSVHMMRATLDLQRQVEALAQSMFAATSFESEAGEDIGPSEQAELQQQLEDIAGIERTPSGDCRPAAFDRSHLKNYTCFPF